MAGEIDKGGLVCSGLVFDGQFVIVSLTVDDRHFEVSRETFLPVLRKVVQTKCLCIQLFGIPYAGVETRGSSVEVVGTVVDGEIVVFYAVQRELSLADSVAVAADERREEWFGTFDDALDAVVPLNDVSELAISVWNHNGHEGTSIVRNRHFMTLFVDKREQISLLALDSGLKIFAFQPRKSAYFHR